MEKLKTILFLMLLNYCNNLMAQDYILFLKKEGSSKDYYNFVVLLNFKKQIEKNQLDENNFQFKFLEFPRDEIELMTCCEIDTITWFTVDEYAQIDKKYNSFTSDSLLIVYQKEYLRMVKYRKKYKNPPFIGNWKDYSIYGYTCIIEVCNCYLKNFSNQRWHGNNVGYLREIKMLKKITKIQQKRLTKYFSEIFSNKQIIEKL